MRNKIIAVNAIIVAIVGLLSFVLMRSAVVSAASNSTQLLAESKYNAQGAAARLELDGLKMARWLSAKAGEAATQDAFNKADPSAAGAAAMAACDAMVSSAKGSTEFHDTVPAMVVFVDVEGKIVGRNGSNVGKGEDLGAVYPMFKAAVAKGNSGTDVWVNKARNDQFLASYVPVRNDRGVIVGSIVAGIQINDELSRISEATTGRALVLVGADKDALSVLARSAADTSALDEVVVKPVAEKGVKEVVSSVIEKGHVDAAQAVDMMVAAAPLEGLGDGKSKVLVVAAPATSIDGASAIPLPILGVTALGLILVVIGGWLLGNYIMAPIGTLEEGLLAILNGQADKRFQIEHAELGGLAFRIDQLLNQLMGVEEDTTDDEGRVSIAPTAAALNAAVHVEPSTGNVNGAALAAEPADAYYARIYGEYIAAKKANNEATDHITKDTFVQRIQGMEAEALQKQGRPVRYQVQARGNEVVLLAVPLS